MPVQIAVAICKANRKGDGVFYLTPIENANQRLYAHLKDMETLVQDTLKIKPLWFYDASKQKIQSAWSTGNHSLLMTTA